MPRTAWTVSDDLAIEVDDFKARYVPGDVIQGRVVRRNRSDYRSYLVQLILLGRVKSKFRREMDLDSSFRGNVVLFESVYTLHNTISTGQVSTELNHSWPFRITIPTHPVPRDPGRPDKSDKFEPLRGFLSNQGDISSHNLPGTFSCNDQFTYDQFVEYVLQAQLRFAGEGTKLESTLPLNVQPLGKASPIDSFQLKTDRSWHCFIRTPKCLPENTSKDLGFRDKLKSKMSGHTPQYAFATTVIAPRMLQLHHPDQIPFKIYVTPKFGKEFSNFGEGDPQGMPPTVFKGLKLKLVAHVKFRAPSTFNIAEAGRTVDYDFVVPRELPEVVVPILIPVQQPPDYEAATGQDPDKGLPPWSTLRQSSARPLVDETKALDLGNLLQLKSHYVRPLHPPPSFASYNLALEYTLDYKVQMRTVDEDHKLEGSVPVSLLAPSEETQAEKRADRAHFQPDRSDDIKEWQRTTGAFAAGNNSRGDIQRLFGVEKAQS